jgi:hypothetical protein
VHAVDVLGRGLVPDEDDLLPVVGPASASSALKTTLPTAAPGEAARPLAIDVGAGGLRIEDRQQVVVEAVGRDAREPPPPW